MDDIDTMIIDELEKNPDASMEAIASKLKISKGTVRNRISRLRESGVIYGKKYRIFYRLLDMEDAFVGLDLMPEYFIDALDEIKKFSFVRELYSTTGDHVAIAYVVEKSDRIDESIRMISAVKGVRKVYPAPVQKILK